MANNIAGCRISLNRLMGEKAVDEFKDAGTRRTDFSVLFPAGGDTNAMLEPVPTDWSAG